MFLEGTRAYEITNSPYMNEMKGIEKQPFFLHFTWDFFNAIMHKLFSLTVMFSLLGAVHKLYCHGRGEEGRPKDNLLHRPYLIKKENKVGIKKFQFWDDMVYGWPLTKDI